MVGSGEPDDDPAELGEEFFDAFCAIDIRWHQLTTAKHGDTPSARGQTQLVSAWECQDGSPMPVAEHRFVALDPGDGHAACRNWDTKRRTSHDLPTTKMFVLIPIPLVLCRYRRGPDSDFD